MTASSRGLRSKYLVLTTKFLRDIAIIRIDLYTLNNNLRAPPPKP